ncbi:MAG: hypothetical protein JSV00_04330, partial [bacterium]
CALDVDCDGVIENGKGGTEDEGEGYVRTVQQRLQFDPPECTWACECVTLEDLGAYSLDESCAVVDSTTTLDEEICATGIEGTTHEFYIEGTVSCVCVEPDLEGLAEELVSGTVKVTYPYGGGPAYFPHTYLDAGSFSGDYLGCTDHTIAQNTTYNANLYSPYETLPAGLVEYPEKKSLPNLPWISKLAF